ncbi:hypothetical protein TI03_00595 [Achromatium sp. WMS1]|nr:hypothetical protein TI03_00595 [Achromatium sp. WMS1]
MEEHLQDWLILWQAPGIGPVTWHRLIQHFGSPTEVLAAKYNALKAAGMKESTYTWLQQPDARILDKSYAWLEQPGNHLITSHHKYYPPLLATIHDTTYL